MKRLPLIATFVLFIALCVSLAWWAMQWIAPAPRSAIAPVPTSPAEPSTEAAASLFDGAATTTAPIGNVQISGTLVADEQGHGVAIVTLTGKPPQSVQTGKEIAPGITLQAVYRNHVLLSEQGVTRQVDLPPMPKQVAARK